MDTRKRWTHRMLPRGNLLHTTFPLVLIPVAKKLFHVRFNVILTKRINNRIRSGIQNKKNIKNLTSFARNFARKCEA